MNFYAIRVGIRNRSSAASQRVLYFLLSNIFFEHVYYKKRKKYNKIRTRKSFSFISFLINGSLPACSPTSTLVFKHFLLSFLHILLYPLAPCFLYAHVVGRFNIWGKMWFLLSATVWPHLILNVFSPSTFMQTFITYFSSAL